MRRIVLYGLFFLCCACRSFDDVDVVVIGGTTAGIEAAVAAKAAVARVVLFEARHALGCDRAGKLLLNAENGKIVEPLVIRKDFDNILLSRKIDFRTWTFVKEIVKDKDGAVAERSVYRRDVQCPQSRVRS